MANFEAKFPDTPGPPALFSEHYFSQPAVRHLAWLVLGPSLIENSDPPVSQPVWPADIRSRLLALDARPQPLLDILNSRPVRRLGLYFEQLYRFALESLLGWEVVLQNHPLRSDGRTLGELDFVVRDPVSGHTEHHEVAVKFYLGWPGNNGSDLPPGWYGPDTRDQLANKLAQLQLRQGRRTEADSVREMLAERNLPQPRSRLLVRGTLFRHPRMAPPPLPEEVNAAHEQGFWYRLSDYQALETDPDNPIVALIKPDWLGPFQCQDKDLSLCCAEREASLEKIRARAHPFLFARLHKTRSGHWLENARFFVTPDSWPA